METSNGIELPLRCRILGHSDVHRGWNKRFRHFARRRQDLATLRGYQFELCGLRWQCSLGSGSEGHHSKTGERSVIPPAPKPAVLADARRGRFHDLLCGYGDPAPYTHSQ